MNISVVDSLVNLAEEAGIPEDFFDEHVTDLAIAEALDTINSTDSRDEQENQITNAENRASRINNEGFSGQIEFLLTAYETVEAGEADIRRQINSFLETK